MLNFITDQRRGEPDILTPFENEVLRITDLDNKPLAEFFIDDSWTHERLLNIAEILDLKGITKFGANAYLGDSHWVGSTEV